MIPRYAENALVCLLKIAISGSDLVLLERDSTVALSS